MNDAYELYIDGKLCDLAEDTAVTLVYQSGMFTELDNIQSNGSHTIELPLTASNRAAIRNAQRPDVDSDIPYSKVSAALYKGGVPLFSEGLAYITEISDEAISVVLTWGNAENFDPLFDSDLADLADTLDDMGIGHVEWNEESSIVTAPAESSGLPQVGFFGVDFGQGLGNPEYLHPSIMVQSIMRAIERYHGITIDGIGRLSPTHLVPCVSENGDENSAKASFLGISLSGNSLVGNLFHIDIYPQQVYHDPRGIAGSGYQLTEINKNTSTIYVDLVGYEGVAKDYFEIRVSPTISAEVQSIYLAFYKKGQSPNSDIMAKSVLLGASYMKYSDGGFTIFRYENISWEGNVADYKEYDYIALKVGPISQTGGSTAVVKIAFLWPDVTFPSVYPVGVNLPDMSQAEFLQQIMSLNGLFAYVDHNTPNTIKLMSPDDILDNVKNGVFVDWSRKVLVNGRRRIDMPDNTSYSIDGYAQRNTLDYDNDEDVETVTEGEILIENKVLDRETELLSLGFSATDNTSTAEGLSIARIPMYEKKDNSDEVTYSEPSPRILSYVEAPAPNGTDRWCYGRFTTAQHFGGAGGIVATKYAGLASILRRFRIITVRARLSALDLYRLDYRVPVYIQQFGRYFAIYKIESHENGIADCQLITLNFE